MTTCNNCGCEVQQKSDHPHGPTCPKCGHRMNDPKLERRLREPTA